MDTQSIDKNSDAQGRLPDVACSGTEIVNKGLGGRWIRCLKCKQARKITNKYVSGQFKRAHVKSCESQNVQAEPSSPTETNTTK